MKTSAAVFSTVLLYISCMAFAGDSPQFRGPNRDGKFDEQGLLKTWPEGGPSIAWIAQGLGRGYSSVSAVQGKLYTTGMLEGEIGHLFVLSADGTVEKKIPYGKETTNDQAPGSRSTPTLDGNRAYLMSALGMVYCIDLDTGAKRWEVNVLERFNGSNNLWNLAESVLIDGERVICTPGGKDAVVAALDKMTGETVWTTKGLEDRASYCSPVIANHHGRRILLAETSKYILGADAETGSLLWSFEQKVPWDIHAVPPVYSNGLVYYTAGDAVGGGALEMAPDGMSVTSKWTNRDLDSLHHGVVLVDGCLYGTSSKRGRLVCVEMATGRTLWSAKEIKECVVVYADGMLYTYEGPKTGIVSLVKAVPSGFERTGQFTVEQGTHQHWAHPTIAHGRLYIRHGDALIAYDVAEKK
ncbi:MAG TPA: PQQ-like beta-propeller repeat protein [Candidatus Hydrogenedentes bacterium]|nr:PQQ-like beta-propeller repeat protein [Candidatus Hydrogenedentota bacterium]HOV75566.1 PQQ-like beta-propeller repeat protein [Candidatus Hydrogenedentota bacterium]HPC17740.1 PQQ-like beta-propeller repeat protein [Candidatus Hydrogenedentota bacterium]HRT20128.1 PQQ-like beta-propeller repeat protein [Candidatus Hydrogenedentota bacterium]HRT66718.1 PQQ-like beta-propeller repeat protein [Candidatus Hydrogenedentota bacterium]